MTTFRRDMTNETARASLREAIVSTDRAYWSSRSALDAKRDSKEISSEAFWTALDHIQGVHDAAMDESGAAYNSAIAAEDEIEEYVLDARAHHTATVSEIEENLVHYGLAGQHTDHIGHHDGDCSIVWLGSEDGSYGVCVTTYDDQREQTVTLVDELCQGIHRYAAFDLGYAVDTQLLAMSEQVDRDERADAAHVLKAQAVIDAWVN